MAEIVFPELKSKVGVYLIASPTGGRYVGSSRRLDKRFNRYKNLSCSRQSAIYSSLKKYGYAAHKFYILMYCDEVDLLFWERCFGDIYLSSADFKHGLNLVLPGYSDVQQHRTKEFNNKVSVIQKKRFENPEQRKKAGEYSRIAYSDPEMRKRHSQILTEAYKNPELRKKRSQLQKEYFSSPDARKKASDATKKYLLENPEQKDKNYSALTNFYSQNKNARSEVQKKWRTEKGDTAAKAQSATMKQYYINNPEARKLISERTTKWLTENHPRARKVLDTETGEILKSAIQVSDRISKPIQTVRNWLQNISPNPTSYKYI